MDYRYSLEKYQGRQTRHTCPGCRQQKTFTYYIDNISGQPVSPVVGRCNRINKCGYDLSPWQYNLENGNRQGGEIRTPIRIKDLSPIKPISYIETAVLKQSLKDYESNNLIIFLNTLFDSAEVERLIKQYLIGTSDRWPGSVIFWQIDCTGKIRTGQIILHDASNGKRIKKPYNHIAWCHKSPYNLEQCLFGEHLIKMYPHKPVGIVEAPKSALIASAYLPQYIWLACGGLQNLSERMCKVVKGRKVFLFPDLDGLDNWREKANQLGFEINDTINRYASAEDREQGLDIADFLIRCNHGSAQEDLTPKNFPSNVPLKPGEKIIDVPYFIESHTAFVDRNKGNRTYKPYSERLDQLRTILGSTGYKLNWNN